MVVVHARPQEAEHAAARVLVGQLFHVPHQACLVQWVRDVQRPLKARALGDRLEQGIQRRLADRLEHGFDFFWCVRKVAHRAVQWSLSSSSVRYASGSSNPSSPSLGSMLTIQPASQQSSLTSSGASSSRSFTALTVPLTGANRSLSVLTLSMVPNAAPAFTASPAFTSSPTSVISPSWSTAKAVMPTTIAPSRCLAHSWSFV